MTEVGCKGRLVHSFRFRAVSGSGGVFRPTYLPSSLTPWLNVSSCYPRVCFAVIATAANLVLSIFFLLFSLGLFCRFRLFIFSACRKVKGHVIILANCCSRRIFVLKGRGRETGEGKSCKSIAETCLKLLDYLDRVTFSKSVPIQAGFVWTTDVDDSELAEFGGDRLSLQVEVLTWERGCHLSWFDLTGHSAPLFLKLRSHC